MSSSLASLLVPFDSSHKGWAVSVSRDRLVACGNAHGAGCWARLSASASRGAFTFAFTSFGDYVWFGCGIGALQPGEGIASRSVWLQGAGTTTAHTRRLLLLVKLVNVQLVWFGGLSDPLRMKLRDANAYTVPSYFVFVMVGRAAGARHPRSSYSRGRALRGSQPWARVDPGAVVTCVVDIDAGVFSYSVDGGPFLKPFPSLWANVREGTPVWPLFALYRGSSVQLLDAGGRPEGGALNTAFACAD